MILPFVLALFAQVVDSTAAVRRVDGNIFRGLRTKQEALVGHWVVLHRLGPDRSGPIDSIRYPADDPRLARVVRPAAGETRHDAAPDLLRVANRDRVETVTGAAQPDGVGVLIDADTHRAMVGSPNAIASTYVQLLFLDGRGLTRLEKLDDRTGTWGRRIASWQIDWAER